MTFKGRHWQLAMVAVMAAAPVAATEGGLGRVVQGGIIQPKAGIVADVPIVALNVTSLWFSGSIGKGISVPVAGTVTTDISAELSLTPITLLKVWDTGKGRWNFASSVTVPVVWNRVSATVAAGNFSNTISQSKSGVFDILFTPITAGYHFSPTSHMAFSLGVWAPTGGFETGRLANTGLNYWTVAPTMAYTALVPSQGFEFSAQAGVQFNTRNTATDYKSAPLVTLDLLAQKSLGSGFSIGGNFSLVQQIGDDKGPLADRLNGFVGQSVALGPMLGWSGAIGGRPVEATLRWMPTLISERRLSGDTILFTFSVPIVLPKAPT